MNRSTLAIDRAVRDLEKKGLPVTANNVKKRWPVNSMTGWEVGEMLERQRTSTINRRLKATHYIVTYSERVPFADASIEELEEQVFIQTDNLNAVRRHEKARRRALDFLKVKRQQLGRPVVPREFQSEIESIYEKQGVPSPF